MTRKQLEQYQTLLEQTKQYCDTYYSTHDMDNMTFERMIATIANVNKNASVLMAMQVARDVMNLFMLVKNSTIERW